MASSCWQITFRPSEMPSPAFDEFMDSFFEVSAQNYAAEPDGIDEYVGYQSGSFDEQAMLSAARSLGVELPPYEISELKSDNWLKDYVIKFPPFEVGDFCIYGIHETTAPQTSKIPLQIYAATVFGSDHQTTRGCITALCELKHRGFSPQKILDIGTGSGILSLCAASLWPSAEILAGDIDEEAVIVSAGNAKTNRLDNRIKTFLSDGCQNPLIAAAAPYDLILSNILANPLISFAADIAENLAPQGYAVLSGFVADQSAGVIAAYQAQGLDQIKLYSLDDWRAALLRKA